MEILLAPGHDAQPAYIRPPPSRSLQRTARRQWPLDWFRLEARAAEPWHAWRTLHRIDENGPVQVARYEWDVEGNPPRAKPTAQPPPAGGCGVQFNQALLAATTPPALAPFAAWCRGLVPSPLTTDLGDTERYRSPAERRGRQFGGAYPFSAWQIPWVVLFASGVFLQGRRRGSPRRLALAWGAATVAFGLAGALAYAFTRQAASRPSPAPAPSALPALRDAQDA